MCPSSSDTAQLCNSSAVLFNVVWVLQVCSNDMHVDAAS